jgi:hypothetical protein
MVDLQRSIIRSLNTDRGWMQDDRGNSDANALVRANRSQIFSALEADENFIRLDFRQL